MIITWIFRTRELDNQSGVTSGETNTGRIIDFVYQFVFVPALSFSKLNLNRDNVLLLIFV